MDHKSTITINLTTHCTSQQLFTKKVYHPHDATFPQAFPAMAPYKGGNTKDATNSTAEQ